MSKEFIALTLIINDLATSESIQNFLRHFLNSGLLTAKMLNSKEFR